MSLTFYYSPMSTASITHLVLEELDLPYEKVKLDLGAGDQRKPDFLKINPNAKVPALVHDGQPVFESLAITLYLGETFGVERGLFPAPGPQRARAMSWLCWMQVSVGASVARFLSAASPRLPAEQHNAATAAIARAEVEGQLALLDRELTGREFVLDRYSLVDAHMASFAGYLGMVGFDLKRYPAVTAWTERCSQRPAVQRAMGG